MSCWAAPRVTRIASTPVGENFGALREQLGPEIDIGIDFHGAVQPQTAMLLIRAFEPYQPFFYEEPIQC